MFSRALRAVLVVSLMTSVILPPSMTAASAAPVISKLSPSSAVAGSQAFTLRVMGTNFVRTDVVRWNASPRTTTFVNAGEIDAAISAADVQAAGIVQVTVFDSKSKVVSTAATFQVSAPLITLAISTTSLANGMVNSAYSATLAATGGTAPYSWNVVSGALPQGLTLSTMGAITGVPATAGTFSFTVQCTDSSATPQSTTAQLSITIAAAPLSVTTTSLAAATVNVSYIGPIAATGGTAPYTWTVAGGQLPAGLNLASSSGTITGIATLTGTYPFTVQAQDVSGGIAQATLSLVVKAQPTVTPFFSGTSFWNTPIPSNAQTDPNSAAIIATSISAYAPNANFSNTDSWGIGIATASATSPSYTVLCTVYCTGDTVTFPIPLGAQPSTGSDHHLAVVNGTQVLDTWKAVYDSTANSWSAGSRVVNDLSGWGATCPQGQHCNGAVAAGFALLGGAVRPEEIAQGHIDHALSITSPYTRASYIACPATHSDGTYSDVNAIPEGAQIQLDPTFNVDAQTWPTWEKLIAKALQTYGAYVSDTGGSLSIRGTTDTNAGNQSWSSVGTPKGGSLADLPWSSFRVVLIQSCN